ncbi:MAG: outer membrane lipoprotein-sorting protein [Spirochaetota bacterium]|nr:outer membrane lipoprotein-sorting protein [Spirochaetota bacterium]
MRKKFLFIIIGTLLLFPQIVLPLYSAEQRDIELKAHEIVARVDSILDYPKGIIKGSMQHITPDGRSRSVNLKGFISEDDYLFTFTSKKRGEEQRILYNLRGEDIWVYHVFAIKLFNKRDIDRFNRILSTNYYYIDLSNADLQSNYNAEIIGDSIIKGYECYELKLYPIFKKGEYGLLTLYVEKSDYIPLRIDYHDTDTVIFKTLSISRVITEKNRIIPIRYDMLDILKGTLTILEFNSFDEDIDLDRNIFRHQNLGLRK